MDLSSQINEIIESTKEIKLNLEEDDKFSALRKDFISSTEKVIDQAAKYVIKAMPVPDSIKDILLDVKDALKTKNLKNVIETAIKSSIREGLEMLNITNINSVIDIKNIATKGGLVTSLKNGIEIVASNYLKNNIVGNYVYDFFDKLKSYIMNKEFSKKLENVVNKLDNKKNEFITMCENWYSAYKNFDLDKINSIAEKLNEDNFVLKRFPECIKENNLIQNMTAMVNSKKEILTQNQQRLCEII